MTSDTISKAVMKHSTDCSIRHAGESGVWLYVDGEPVKHVTPTELRSMVEEDTGEDLH